MVDISFFYAYESRLQIPFCIFIVTFCLFCVTCFRFVLSVKQTIKFLTPWYYYNKEIVSNFALDLQVNN